MKSDGKQGTSFRLTVQAHSLLAALARKLGLPRSGVLEVLIRERAAHERLAEEADVPDV